MIIIGARGLWRGPARGRRPPQRLRHGGLNRCVFIPVLYGACLYRSDTARVYTGPILRVFIPVRYGACLQTEAACCRFSFGREPAVNVRSVAFSCRRDAAPIQVRSSRVGRNDASLHRFERSVAAGHGREVHWIRPEIDRKVVKILTVLLFPFAGPDRPKRIIAAAAAICSRRAGGPSFSSLPTPPPPPPPLLAAAAV